MTKEVMREALTRIAEGNLGDAPWQANYTAIKRIATEALAQPEQESFSPEAISATQAAWKMGYDAAKAEQPEQEPVARLTCEELGYVPLSADGKSVYIDGVGLVRLAQPEQDVPEASCGNMVPVGWLESPDGAFRANPLYKIKFPSKLLSWQVSLYTAAPQRKPLTDEEIEEKNT